MSPGSALRLLLDQNFPQPVIDLQTVDATVTVTSLDTFDRTLTEAHTPDWLIYLRGAEEGFDAVVTRDRSQLDEPEELVALTDTGLNVITWQNAIEDPIVEWGQLLAFMGHIRRRLEDKKGLVIRLPKPRLGKDNVEHARALLGKMSSATGASFQEIRNEARTAMIAELRHRGRDDLAGLLGGRTEDPE